MSARRGAGRGPWLAALACAALGLLAAGCVEATGCTSAVCRESIGFLVENPDRTWAAGLYELTMTLDGKSAACSLVIGQDPPADGRLGFGCDSHASAVLTNRLGCGSSSCDPGAPYLVVGSVDGSPDRFRLEVRRDGQLLLDKEVSPSYPDSGDCPCRVTSPKGFRLGE